MPYTNPEDQSRLTFAVGYIFGFLSAVIVGGLFYILGGYDLRGR